MLRTRRPFPASAEMDGHWFFRKWKRLLTTAELPGRQAKGRVMFAKTDPSKAASRMPPFSTPFFTWPTQICQRARLLVRWNNKHSHATKRSRARNGSNRKICRLTHLATRTTLLLAPESRRVVVASLVVVERPFRFASLSTRVWAVCRLGGMVRPPKAEWKTRPSVGV